MCNDKPTRPSSHHTAQRVFSPQQQHTAAVWSFPSAGWDPSSSVSFFLNSDDRNIPKMSCFRLASSKIVLILASIDQIVRQLNSRSESSFDRSIDRPSFVRFLLASHMEVFVSLHYNSRNGLEICHSTTRKSFLSRLRAYVFFDILLSYATFCA